MSFIVSTSVDLQPYNAMAVPAKAAYLSPVECEADIVAARKFIESKKIPLMVLGEGSNTLFTQDYKGLIIHNKIKGVELIEELPDSYVVKVGAGENWHDFVSLCMNNNWFGLENLALIPGQVGAAPIQNIGAYGIEVRELIVAVDYYDLQKQGAQRLFNRDCQFSYRDSIFKAELANRAVITAVIFRLRKTSKPQLSYPALEEYFSRRPAPSPQQVFTAVCHIRNSKLPLPKKIPNLGSFFKNPVIDSAKYAKLVKKHPSLVSYEVPEGRKIAAGWLIEEAGWKQKIIGDVAVHHQQALVIINPLGATGKAVLEFAKAVQADIKRKFGVLLEIEPQLV